MSGAYLSGAYLSEAYLSEAYLSGAELSWADLSGADLGGADLRGVFFEPKQESILKIKNIFSAQNLSELKYSDNPKTLVMLREEFKKCSLRRQEREVTCAIKRTQRKKLWNDEDSNILNKIESSIYLVFFELTCAYGMSPGRLFLILVGFIFVFTIPYTISILRDNEDGIWVVWISDRVRIDLGAKKPVRLTGKGLPAFKVGFYFSILSAFSIGWRELNVGNWIARIQKYEYALRATGWVRMISGIQSLISVFLLALWVLTFFGRPFESF